MFVALKNYYLLVLSEFRPGERLLQPSCIRLDMSAESITNPITLHLLALLLLDKCGCHWYNHNNIPRVSRLRERGRKGGGGR